MHSASCCFFWLQTVQLFPGLAQECGKLRDIVSSGAAGEKRFVLSQATSPFLSGVAKKKNLALKPLTILTIDEAVCGREGLVLSRVTSSFLLRRCKMLFLALESLTCLAIDEAVRVSRVSANCSTSMQCCIALALTSKIHPRRPVTGSG